VRRPIAGVRQSWKRKNKGIITVSGDQFKKRNVRADPGQKRHKIAKSADDMERLGGPFGEV